jgi:AcrB/AcrD/AcrF family protein
MLCRRATPFTVWPSTNVSATSTRFSSSLQRRRAWPRIISTPPPHRFPPEIIQQAIWLYMTSFAFILGVYPLVVAQGAVEISRHGVGTPVFAGMIAASGIGLFVIPMLYVTFQSLREPAPAQSRPSTRLISAKSDGSAGPSGLEFQRHLCVAVLSIVQLHDGSKVQSRGPPSVALAQGPSAHSAHILHFYRRAVSQVLFLASN